MHHRIGLVLALMGGALLQPALGQPPAAPKDVVLEIPAESTLLLQMSQRQVIKAVRSENDKIARVTIKVDDPKTVLITSGANDGSTRLFLTDVNNNTEVFTVVVPAIDYSAFAPIYEGKMAKLIRQYFPTANVKVQVLPAPIVSRGTDGKASPPKFSVILTGTVHNVEDVGPIHEIVKSALPDIRVPDAQVANAGGIVSLIASNIQIINQIRTGYPQLVQLDVTVARVNRSELRSMSFNFLLNRNGNWYAGSNLKSSLLNSTLAPAIGGSSASLLTAGSNIPFGFIANPYSLIGFLEALRTENAAKLTSQPSVTTLSGRPAQIVSGGKVPVVTQSSTGAPSVAYENFGTIVDCLPIVMGNKIYLEVRPTVSAVNAALSFTPPGSNTTVPGFDQRSAQVTVIMEDGQTLAIGGLISYTTDATAVKVPVLGDLPFVGTAFRSVRYEEKEEELLILVTPRFVDPMNCCQLPKYLPGQETRSPDDFELFLEGILEAPRGHRDVFIGRRSYLGAHMSGPTAQQYPCAGCGNGNGYGPMGSACDFGGCGTFSNGHGLPVNGHNLNGHNLNGHNLNGHGLNNHGSHNPGRGSSIMQQGLPAPQSRLLQPMLSPPVGGRPGVAIQYMAPEERGVPVNSAPPPLPPMAEYGAPVDLPPLPATSIGPGYGRVPR